MQDFRMPKKERHIRRKKHVQNYLGMMLFAAFLGTTLLTIIRVRPVYMEYAIDVCQDTALMQVNTSMQKLVFDHPELFSNMVTLERDRDNRITALTTDVIAIGQVKAQVVNDLYIELDDLKHTTVEVPLGSILAPSYYMGMGPSIEMGMVALTNISAEFISSFTSAGINQTRHQIIIEIKAEYHMVTAMGVTDIDVVSCFPVTDTVIVGTVPERYTYITGYKASDSLGMVRDLEEMDQYDDTEPDSTPSNP